MSFDAILSRIASGESVPSAELLPYLCLERREQRANANMLLARAYRQSSGEENLQHARVFIQRAWLLSGFSPELLPLYIEIHSALGDVRAIREAYKQLGIAAAERSDVAEAIRYFDLWQFAYHNFKNLDQYEYDFDILAAVDRLARPYRFPNARAALPKDGKIRVAYLLKGMTELGSVLIKINLLFARFHDRSRVEPLFFTPEAGRVIRESAAGREHLRLFESYGCRLMTAPDGCTTQERLLAVARMIHDARPDALIASAALANFEQCFITALRPAPVIMGFVQGPPQQFAPLTLDWGLAWSKHPLIDCPVSCTLMAMELELPSRVEVMPYNRRELKMPVNAVVVASAGRYVKFQDREVWRAIIDLLEEHSNMFYLALGVEESQIPFLPSMMSPEIRSRIRFMSWRGDDYLRGLATTDILIDTFPSGGGAILSDAMALGVPIVSFKNNYMRQYDQTDWSPAEEFIHTNTVVARGDLAEMKRVVSRLINDELYRREVGQTLQEHIRRTRGEPARAVSKCEDAYVRIFEQLSAVDAPADPRGLEVEELSQRLVRHRPAPQWIALPARQLRRVLRFGERVLNRVSG